MSQQQPNDPQATPEQPSSVRPTQAQLIAAMGPNQRTMFYGRAVGRAGWIATLLGAIVFLVLVSTSASSSDAPLLGVTLFITGLVFVVVGKVMKTRAVMRHSRSVRDRYDANLDS